jgi:hypothetical protein
MLETTAATVFEYCRRQDLTYEIFVGIKRGYAPWHATYNRIMMLKEIVDRGASEWVLYLDADAYVTDMDFPIKEYLRNRGDYAAIFTPSLATENLWDVNAGVCLFNFSNIAAKEVVMRWHAEFMRITEDDLREKETWAGGRNDQDLLQKVLRDNPEIMADIYLEDPSLLNSRGGRFIRQLLRSHEGDFSARMDILRREVGATCGYTVDGLDANAFTEEDVIVAVYRSLLARNPDPIGAAHYRSTLQRRGMRIGLASVITTLLASPEARNLQKRTHQR